MSILARSLNNAVALHRSGKLAEAETIYRWVVSQAVNPQDRAETLHLLALCKAAQGRPDEAVAAFRECIAASPDDPRFHDALGQLLLNLKRYSDAADAYREVTRLAPQALPAYINLGNALINARDYPGAVAAFESILRTDPNHTVGLFSLAFLAERMSDRAKARSLCDQALTLAPDDVDANILMARLDRRESRFDDARRRLERILPACRNARDFGRAAVELGFALDSLGEHRRAFEAFAQGQQALYSIMDPLQRDKAAATIVIDRCRESITPERVAAWASPPKDDLPAPIFLIGFPRSGTTLVEQMLAAHPRFVTTEEISFLYKVKSAIPQMVDVRKPYPEALDDFTPADIAAMRRRYWEEARAGMGQAIAGKRLVEKHPLTLIDLPLVRRLFPEALLIVCLRDPRDACLSSFMQDFDRGTPHFYDLGWTVEFYEAVMGLWLRYRPMLGLKFHELRYEDLVQEPEKHARSLVSFLGEPWNDSVMKFFAPEHRRYVTTPSYADVARPVYASSVNRWKHYTPEMEALQPALAPFVAAFGYEPA